MDKIILRSYLQTLQNSMYNLFTFWHPADVEFYNRLYMAFWHPTYMEVYNRFCMIILRSCLEAVQNSIYNRMTFWHPTYTQYWWYYTICIGCQRFILCIIWIEMTLIVVRVSRMSEYHIQSVELHVCRMAEYHIQSAVELHIFRMSEYHIQSAI